MAKLTIPPSTTKRANLDDLPIEVITMITADFDTVDELLSLRHTCRTLYHTASIRWMKTSQILTSYPHAKNNLVISKLSEWAADSQDNQTRLLEGFKTVNTLAALLNFCRRNFSLNLAQIENLPNLHSHIIAPLARNLDAHFTATNQRPMVNTSAAIYTYVSYCAFIHRNIPAWLQRNRARPSRPLLFPSAYASHF